MKRALILFALALPLSALATDYRHPDFVRGGNARSDARSDARSVSESTSNANAVTGASTSNASNQLSINVPAAPTDTTARIEQSGRLTIRAAPSIDIAGPASGPCTGRSGGIGGSWLGGSIGANFAEVERACTLRENARVFAMILPALRAEDASEVRVFLLNTLRTIYEESLERNGNFRNVGQ